MLAAKKKELMQTELKPYGFCCSEEIKDPETRYNQKIPPFEGELDDDGPTFGPNLRFKCCEISHNGPRRPKGILSRRSQRSMVVENFQGNKHGSLKHYVEEEIDKARELIRAEQLRLMRKQRRKEIAIAVKKDKKARVKYTKNLLGPPWYQELSNKQLILCNSLQGIMTADHEEKITARTIRSLVELGITNVPVHITARVVRSLRESARLDAVQFLLGLYTLISGRTIIDEYKDPKTDYTINERILLTAIAGQCFPAVLLQVNQLMPPVKPRILPPRPKPEKQRLVKKSCPYLEKLPLPPDWVKEKKKLEKWRIACERIPRPCNILPDLEIAIIKYNESKNESPKNNANHKLGEIEERGMNTPGYRYQSVNDELVTTSGFDFVISGLSETPGSVDFQLTGIMNAKMKFDQKNSEIKDDVRQKEIHSQNNLSGVAEDPPEGPLQFEISGTKHVGEEQSVQELFDEVVLSKGSRRVFPEGRGGLSCKWQTFLNDVDEEFYKLAKKANVLLKSVEATTKVIFSPTCDPCCACRSTKKWHEKYHKTKVPWMQLEGMKKDEDGDKYLLGGMTLHSPAPSPTDSLINLVEISAAKKTEPKFVMQGIVDEMGQHKFIISGVTFPPLQDTRAAAVPVPGATTISPRTPRNVPPCSCSMQAQHHPGDKTTSISPRIDNSAATRTKTINTPEKIPGISNTGKPNEVSTDQQLPAASTCYGSKFRLAEVQNAHCTCLNHRECVCFPATKKCECVNDEMKDHTFEGTCDSVPLREQALGHKLFELKSEVNPLDSLTISKLQDWSLPERFETHHVDITEAPNKEASSTTSQLEPEEVDCRGPLTVFPVVPLDDVENRVPVAPGKKACSCRWPKRDLIVYEISGIHEEQPILIGQHRVPAIPTPYNSSEYLPEYDLKSDQKVQNFDASKRTCLCQESKQVEEPSGAFAENSISGPSRSREPELVKVRPVCDCVYKRTYIEEQERKRREDRMSRIRALPKEKTFVITGRSVDPERGGSAKYVISGVHLETPENTPKPSEIKMDREKPHRHWSATVLAKDFVHEEPKVCPFPDGCKAFKRVADDRSGKNAKGRRKDGEKEANGSAKGGKNGKRDSNGLGEERGIRKSDGIGKGMKSTSAVNFAEDLSRREEGHYERASNDDGAGRVLKSLKRKSGGGSGGNSQAGMKGMKGRNLANKRRCKDDYDRELKRKSGGESGGSLQAGMKGMEGGNLGNKRRCKDDHDRELKRMKKDESAEATRFADENNDGGAEGVEFTDNENVENQQQKNVIIEEFEIDYEATPEAQLKNALNWLARDRAQILPKLPFCENMPQFRAWLHLRSGKKLKTSDKEMLLDASKRLWERLEKAERYDITEVDMPLKSAQVKKMNFNVATQWKNTIAQVVKKYHDELRLARVQNARRFWTTLFMDLFPSKTFKDCFFTYMASCEADGHLFRPWQRDEVKERTKNRCAR